MSKLALLSPVLRGIVSQPEVKFHHFIRLEPEKENLIGKICFDFHTGTT